MYVGRALRKAFSETKAFWSIHRNWAFVSVPASGVLLHTLWKGWSTVTDAKEIVLFLLFGYVFSWIGSFLINLFRAPALLDRERQKEIEDLKRQHADEMKEVRVAFAGEKQLLIAQGEELRQKLAEPKIVPEIVKYEFEEVAHPGPSLESVVESVLGGNVDTIVKLSIRLANEHRQPTAIQKCELSVRARPPGITYLSRDEPIRDVQNYVRLKLEPPIEYGFPRLGWLFFRFERRKQEDLIEGELQLSVIDGTGKISTATMHITRIGPKGF